MGENEGWAQFPGGVVLPNGLLPNAGPVVQVLDPDRWLKAEERTAELIACIQPNPPSEERRNAVADYVQRLIMKCFPCQVFTFGSVPLKTYLPDGDIDLTAFSNSQTLKDTWANQVRVVLENEEKNENAEFRVKEVQYIQAEVKLIKCLVENIVVDISFNQLGGLCTLCFLEEVDHLISQNHLFKRSIILIKAWCYYESRVLGAHHGLISTYALETLVLYIFHVFNNSFTGPLEVLYRFLEFFSKFDWDNFCVSLWGPVPITSLPDVTAEPPRKDRGELLLSKLFLDACSSVYAVLPGGQENNGQPFVSKHFNVIDPLRVNNNLGRSVGKGNFFRIRSAFAFGAKRLARLLDCPKENLVQEVNTFFTNTWNRHGSGNRPDAPSTDLLRSRLSSLHYSHGSSSLKNGLNTKKVSENISDYDTEVERSHSRKLPSQHGYHPLEVVRTTADPTPTQSQRVYGSLNTSRVFDQAIRDSSPKLPIDKGQKTSRPDLLVNDIPGRNLFARTRSSPELTDASVSFSPQGRRNKAPEGGKTQATFTRTETTMNKNQGSENLDSFGARSSASDHSPIRHVPSHQSLDAVKSNSSLNSYHCENGPGAPSNELPFISEAQRMDEEEQDLVNMMGSTNLHGLNGQFHLPLNLASGHLPFPISPSILASMGYGHRNFPGMVSPNFHFIDPSMSHMQFPQGFVPPPMSQYFPGVQLNPNSEDMIEPNNENFIAVEMNSEEGDHGSWQEQDIVSPGSSVSDTRNFEILHSDDMPQPSSVAPKFVPSSRGSGSVSSSRNQQKLTKENRVTMRESYPYQDNGNDYSDDKITAPRLSSSGRSSSLRSRTSSEGSWDGSSAKVSRTTKEKRGKKTAHTDPSSSYEKVKKVSEHNIQPVEDDEVWDTRSTMGDVAERSSQLQSVGSVHGPMPHIHGYELAQTSGSDSMMPMGPMLIGHGSRQRAMDNSGVVFYPTGPPVPFLTMLPVYNVPPEAGNADSPTSHLGVEEGMDRTDPSQQHFDPSEKFHQIEELHTNPSRMATYAEASSDKKPDILNSDFASHWQNLLIGRFCQNPRSPGGPAVYPSPVAVPPMYLQGRVPFDGPGRPMSANMNLFTQLMGGYGPRLIPVAPFQSASNRPPGVYQHYVEEIQRPRSGTGTYLPNLPKVSPRERNPAGPRRGNYNYERNDSHGEGERNWNSSKSRAAGRNNIRGQNEKSNSRVNSNESRTDRPWNSYKRDSSSSSYQAQNNQLRSSNSSQSATAAAPSMAYNMYPMHAMNPNGVVSSNGPSVPSGAVMYYPVDHNANYDTPPMFGSFGPMGFSSSTEQRQVNEGNRARGGAAFDEQMFHGQRSSPEQPSSPHMQRRNFTGQ